MDLPTTPNVASSLNDLAGHYVKLGRAAEAEPLLQRALVIYEETLGPEHPTVAAVRQNYASLLRHRPREAAPVSSLGQRLRAWLSGR